MTKDLSAADFDRACLLVGRFMYHFALLEGALNTGIEKLLGLRSLEGAIATANMPLRSKIHILKSVVNLKGGPVEWVKTFDEVVDFSTVRNTVAHTIFGPEAGGGVRFLAVKAKTRLTFQNTVWTERDFLEHSKRARSLSERVSQIIETIEPNPQAINALLALALTDAQNPTAAMVEAPMEGSGD